MPEHVRRFIATSVPSIPYLEALLLLRSNRGVAWSPKEVATRLYLAEATAGEVLGTLASAGVATTTLATDGTWLYLYAPFQEGLAELIDEVAQIYALDLVGVTTLVHARLDKRAVQFADAFRWKKDI
jgi:hypothetical protein